VITVMNAPEERALRRFGEITATKVLLRLGRDGAPPLRTSLDAGGKTFVIAIDHGDIELQYTYIAKRYSIRVRHTELGLVGWAVAGHHGNADPEGPIKQAFLLLEQLAAAQTFEGVWGDGEREILDDLVA
jgi:hypothetical protein